MSDRTEVRNLILLALSKSAQDDVLAVAEYVHLDLRENIIQSNKQIQYVDFPENGVMSVVLGMDDGSIVEIGTVGKEGMLGWTLLMGVPIIETTVFCQVEGSSWRIPAASFVDICEKHAELKALCLKYSIVFHNQVSRSMGCNRAHELEERCARWLLMTHDRCNSTDFGLTQEFLAAMLGVSRTSVNLAAGILSKAGLIKYVRGKITILDRPGLENVCCQCYFAQRDYAEKTMSTPVG